MSATPFRPSDVCPGCGDRDSSGVLNSRAHKAGRLRRRRCHLCGERWTTIEISVRDYTALQRIGGFISEIEARIVDAQDVIGMPFIGSEEDT